MAVIFAILYMQFTAFPYVFQGYRHWSPGVSALAFVGVTVGAFMSLAYIIFFENPRYARQLAAKGYLPPEARLPSTILGACLLPCVHRPSELTPVSACSSSRGPASPSPSTGSAALSAPSPSAPAS